MAGCRSRWNSRPQATAAGLLPAAAQANTAELRCPSCTTSRCEQAARLQVFRVAPLPPLCRAAGQCSKCPAAGNSISEKGTELSGQHTCPSQQLQEGRTKAETWTGAPLGIASQRPTVGRKSLCGVLPA